MRSAELYLVRHAEAGGADLTDPALSDRGREQAARLGARLAGAGPLSVLLHSPRQRAVQTAAILAEHLPGVPVRGCGPLDDRTPVPSPERRGEYPERYWPWLEATRIVEQDLDAATLSRAVDELVDEALLRSEAGPLVLVTHAFVVGWFVRAALDAPTWRWLSLRPANAALTVIRYGSDRTSSLVRFNDDGHLG